MRNRAKQLENYSARAGEPWDVEEERLQAEFAGLDLTETEMVDLHEAFRLRRSGATASERIASRQLFAAVRNSLKEALRATLDHETGSDRMIRALAVFDRDEAIGMQRLEVGLLRPQTDENLASIKRAIARLDETRTARRKAVVAEIAASSDISTLPKSDAVRIHSRDGLASLFDKGKISLRQRMAGLAYRRRWEAAFRSLRSALASQGGSASLRQIVAMHERAALWEEQRSRCDSAIALRLREHSDALMILRRVAGEGVALTAIVGSARKRERGLMVLCKALDLVADLLPYEDC